MKKLGLLLSLFFMQIAFAATPVLTDRTQEKRFEVFTHSLRCLKCQHQSIAESDSEFSKDVKSFLVEAIIEGRSDQEINNMLQARFGDHIFLDPPWQWNTYLLWFLPIILCVIGLGFWTRQVKS